MVRASGSPSPPDRRLRVDERGADWSDIIEAVADAGRSSLRAVRSLLLQVILKAAAWPESIHVAHWRSKAKIARINVADAYAPSMRQLIDVDDLYAKALRSLPERVDGHPPLAVSPTSATTFAELPGDAAGR